MSAHIWTAAAYVVVTKFLDCWTTQRFVRSAAAEGNPLASGLMRRFGFARVVWAVFAFTAAWACGLAVAASMSGSLLMAWGYALLGAFVGTVQLAVALTNATGRYNAVTRIVRAAHTRAALRR